MKFKLTIFTPTFNRMMELKKLYESLCNQTNKNFIWLIVDDGSADSTKAYVEKISKEKKILIEYIEQQNQGKYIAHNTGVLNCKTEYFFCVDSDDILAENAIERILDLIEKNKISQNKELLGIVIPRTNKSSNKMISNIKLKDNKIDIMDLKFLFNKNIETCIIIKNDLLKEHLFEKFDEKFMSEEVLYNCLSKYGKFLFIDEKNLYYYNYLDDGLTKNITKLWKNNANTTIKLLQSRYYFLSKYSFFVKFYNRVKTIISLNAICIVSNKKILNYTPSKLLSIFLIFPSFILAKTKYN